MANPHNLRSLTTRTMSEQREIARKGGIASGEARREKKLMSQIYADYLSKKEGLTEGMTLESVIETVLARGDSSSVSMMKEIREATEGQKHTLANDFENQLFQDEAFKVVLAKHGL
jgi:hypothetical protein